MPTKEELEVQNAELLQRLEKAESAAHDATVSAANAATDAADAKDAAAAVAAAMETDRNPVAFNRCWRYPPDGGPGIIVESASQLAKVLRDGWQDTPGVKPDPNMTTDKESKG